MKRPISFLASISSCRNLESINFITNFQQQQVTTTSVIAIFRTWGHLANIPGNWQRIHEVTVAGKYGKQTFVILYVLLSAALLNLILALALNLLPQRRLLFLRIKTLNKNFHSSCTVSWRINCLYT